MTILAIDVGGTHVKILASDGGVPRRIPSGPTMTAKGMVTAVKRLAQGWRYDAVAIGFPGVVMHGRPIHEPANLGTGWVGFDFRRAFGKPVKVMNDAAMQALGSYRGGRMLFLGFGTGLGSAFVVDGVVEPIELAHLPYKKGRSYEDYVGRRGLERLGKKRWQRAVEDVAGRLRAALEADDLVLGGGNAKLLTSVPPNARLGDNVCAFAGGFRLWDQRPSGARRRRQRRSSDRLRNRGRRDQLSRRKRQRRRRDERVGERLFLGRQSERARLLRVHRVGQRRQAVRVGLGDRVVRHLRRAEQGRGRLVTRQVGVELVVAVITSCTICCSSLSSSCSASLC